MHTTGLQQHEVVDVETLVTVKVVVVEVVVVVGIKEDDTTVVGSLAVIVSATVTVVAMVETTVLTWVWVMVVNGPVGTLLVTIAAGPSLHKAQMAFVHPSLSMSFISKKGGGPVGWTRPQKGV